MKSIRATLDRLVPRTRFVSYVLTLMTGAIVAQVITFAALPIMTRLYSPADFGVLAFFSAITAFGSVLATARYEVAIVLPKHDRDAFNLLALSLVIAAAVSTIALLMVVIIEVAEWNRLRELIGPDISWLYLIPLMILLSGISQAIFYWLTRMEEYRRVSFIRVAQSTTIAVVSITGGLIGGGAYGLIYGVLAGQLLALVISVLSAKSELFRIADTLSWNRMMLNARRYREFPLINSPHVLVDALQSSGIPLIIGTYFGSVVLGNYSLSLRVLSAPFSIVGSSLAQVFFQKAAKLHSQGIALTPAFLAVTWRLALFSCVGLTFAWTLDDLIVLVFGSAWQQAGDYSQLILPWLLAAFVLSPVSQLPMILGRQGRMFVNAIIGNSIMILSVFWGIYIGDLKEGLLLLSLLMVIYFLFLWVWFYKISGIQKN